MAGTYRQVSAGLVRLTAAARQVGLQVNPAKYELVACGGGSSLSGPSFLSERHALQPIRRLQLVGCTHWRCWFLQWVYRGRTGQQSVATPRGTGSAGRCSNHFAPPASMCLVLPHGVLHSGYAPQGLGASIAILRHGSPRLPRGRVQWATHTGGLDASLSFDEVWGLGSSKRGPARCCRLRGFTLGYRPLCKDIDGNYDADQGAALHQVNLALPPADHFPVPAPHPPRQQELSRALDRVVIAQLATTSSTPNSGTAAKPGRPRATRLVWRGQHVGAFLAAWRPLRLRCSAKVGKSRRRRLGKARLGGQWAAAALPGWPGFRIMHFLRPFVASGRHGIPQLFAFSCQPTGTTTLSELGCLQAVPAPATRSGAEHGLGQHEEVPSGLQTVSAGDLRKGPWKALGPNGPGSFGDMPQDRGVCSAGCLQRRAGDCGGSSGRAAAAARRAAGRQRGWAPL